MKLKTAKKVVLIMWGAMLALDIPCIVTKGTTASLIFACLSVAAAISGSVVGFLFLKCPHCGSHILHGRRFCPDCGKQLDW